MRSVVLWIAKPQNGETGVLVLLHVALERR